ncbi:MAG: 1,4-alpha-glucan-branching protein [Cyanobacteria bacterium QS_8_64_29]|nr:MAG: 1,4-alpha-glucan-branching protein [Cyanobacteria bacterium QS_8_64_29]
MLLDIGSQVVALSLHQAIAWSEPALAAPRPVPAVERSAAAPLAAPTQAPLAQSVSEGNGNGGESGSSIARFFESLLEAVQQFWQSLVGGSTEEPEASSPQAASEKAPTREAGTEPPPQASASQPQAAPEEVPDPQRPAAASAPPSRERPTQQFDIDLSFSSPVIERYVAQSEPFEGDAERFVLERSISPDAASLNLAAVEALSRQPQLDPDSFQPDVGVRFHDDGSVTVRALVGNASERLRLIGDFNNWGQGVDLAQYELHPTEANPQIHALTLPPDDYHKDQYRLVDGEGNQRLHMSADLFATPAFNQRFYDDRQGDALNAVLWEPQSPPRQGRPPKPDMRDEPLVIAEADPISLAWSWECPNPDSRFHGQTGEQNVSRLYRFISECGLPERMAELGYNVVQFMPLDAHIDFWDPERRNYPDWRYSYQTLNFYGKHADFGSPDELREMVDAFHRADVAVVLDVIYSHFPVKGNNPPRQFEGLGFDQYVRADGSGLYGGPWTKWETKRFNYTPKIRKNIIDAALNNLLNYGFDGIRLDNTNGIDYEPYGRQLMRELAAVVRLYDPRSLVIAEGYFGDPYLNRALRAGGAGMTTTYSDRFYLWFTEQILKHRDEIDMWYLNYMLDQDWPRAFIYYPGNHDEFANPGNSFQTRGMYLAEALDVGEFHNQKIRSWSALAQFASSYYLDMVQLWTLQPGNFNHRAAIEWDRLGRGGAADRLVRFQRNMKEFFQSEPAFAARNLHRNVTHWIDDANQTVTFERIDFGTGKRVYVTVNLGDRAISDYRIPVASEEATFRRALDSDQPAYGGEGRNPETREAQDGELSFYLGSYGVTAWVQQDNFPPPPQPPGYYQSYRPDGFAGR